MKVKFFLAMLGLSFALVGCSGTSESTPGDPSEGPDSRPTMPAGALTLTMWAERGTPPIEHSISCEDEASFCASVVGNEALLPVPPETACTMIYGGPEQATIVGTVEGSQVHLSFNRSNGCELSRWEALVGALNRLDQPISLPGSSI